MDNAKEKNLALIGAATLAASFVSVVVASVVPWAILAVWFTFLGIGTGITGIVCLVIAVTNWYS